MLERLWGTIPVSPETRGAKLPGAVGRRWLHVVARHVPLPPAGRAALHRRRGVVVGRRVFIGSEVHIDDAVPSSVTLEDDVTVIGQTTILGHTYYPRHFHRLLGDEETREGLRTTIRRGAYGGRLRLDPEGGEDVRGSRQRRRAELEQRVRSARQARGDLAGH